MTTRHVQDSDHTKRWRAIVILATGKQVEAVSDWKQSHWAETEADREKVLQEAKKKAHTIRRDYGVECEGIQLREEYRRVVRVIEETVTSKTHSIHHLPKES